MRFSGVLSLSFLLVGANAGVLEDNGYTFKDLGDGLCTVTSEQSSRNGQLPDKFKVNKADKSMTVIHLNYFGNGNPGQLSTSAMMAAVSRQYDLEPDNLNKVTMTVFKDFCLDTVLTTYRSIHSDLKNDEKIDATLTRTSTNSDPDRDVWLDLYDCMPFKVVNRMLTINSLMDGISIKEDDETCLMSFFIGPNEVDDESRIHNFDELGHRHSDVTFRRRSAISSR